MYAYIPDLFRQHCLYFFPLPQGHGSFGLIVVRVIGFAAGTGFTTGLLLIRSRAHAITLAGGRLLASSSAMKSM